MLPLMNSCVTQFLSKLPTNIDFNVYAFYKRLTFDVICSCGFGLQQSSSSTSSSPTIISKTTYEDYFEKTKELFSTDLTQRWWLRLTVVLGSMSLLSRMIEKFIRLADSLKRYLNECEILPLKWRMKFVELPRFWLNDRVSEIVDRAEIDDSDGMKRNDFVHILLRALKKDSESGSMSYGEILNNISLFMAAGYETSSSALAYSTYVLATHMDEQLKLQMEIDDVDFVENGLDYDSIIRKFEYLDRFIREVLRMYPIPPQVINRQCEHDTTVTDSNGREYMIKKGDIVQPDIYSIHYSSDYWGSVDPYIFYPDRHLSIPPHTPSFLAFGLGPRHCIGMRFALLEIKLTLIRLLKNYTIVKSDQLDEKWNINEKRVITPDECWIKLEKR
ncbi:unnamed protein product [Didymodactylos carnosus]|nr:unnamed protein product [Didymodactylos carnosus]CAF3773566.1 unnamed protein product [Didymodactylos carnosus]